MALLRANELLDRDPGDLSGEGCPQATLISLMQVPPSHPAHREACLKAIRLITRLHLVDECFAPFVAPLLASGTLDPREAMAVRALANMYEQERRPTCALTILENLASIRPTDVSVVCKAAALRKSLTSMLSAADRVAVMHEQEDRLVAFLSAPDDALAPAPASVRRPKTH